MKTRRTAAARQWLPTIWLDEVVPSLAEDPTDFLEKDEAGIWHVRPCDEQDRESGCYDIVVEPGQIVGWCYFEPYDDVTLTIDESGDFVVDGTYPAAANGFIADNDGDTFAESMDDLVSGCGNPLDPGTYKVQVYFWSDEILHVAEIAPEGSLRFRLCAEAQ
ncbi:hypothetical protein [Aurantimonas sp. VKM B-3413]|uniref:hypothetical protein n=1 Tax=Aurantimonas sp. VKM B-3413 TaxID=2779401 RepID=UPI001E3A485D|nr:hypothetical protein [Aurantimonas sp. VKM B-3413]MCB8835974.1 hypothetical protein [Aurantimonas sp. VKM B-3413]